MARQISILRWLLLKRREDRQQTVCIRVRAIVHRVVEAGTMDEPWRGIAAQTWTTELCRARALRETRDRRSPERLSRRDRTISSVSPGVALHQPTDGTPRSRASWVFDEYDAFPAAPT